jgi:DNA polymerase III epsilon subunit-like protein
MPPFFYLHPDIAGMCYIKLLNNLEVNKFSLAELCKYFDIERDKSKEHNALEDARTSFELYKKVVNT